MIRTMVVRTAGSNRAMQRPRIISDAIVAPVGRCNIIQDDARLRNATTTAANASFKIVDELFIIVTIRALHKLRLFIVRPEA